MADGQAEMFDPKSAKETCQMYHIAKKNISYELNVLCFQC